MYHFGMGYAQIVSMDICIHDTVETGLFQNLFTTKNMLEKTEI